MCTHSFVCSVTRTERISGQTSFRVFLIFGTPRGADGFCGLVAKAPDVSPNERIKIYEYFYMLLTLSITRFVIIFHYNMTPSSHKGVYLKNVNILLTFWTFRWK